MAKLGYCCCIGSFFKTNTRLLSLVLLGSILLYLGYISLNQSLTNQFASIGIKYIEKSKLYATKQNENSKSITFKNWSIVYEQHVRKSGGTSLTHLLNHNRLRENSTRYKVISSTHDQNVPFRKVKAIAKRVHTRLIGTEYYPFYTHSYLFSKHYMWNDILLVIMFRNPLNRIFSDLIYGGTWKCDNIKYRALGKDSVTENQLIECLQKHHAKFTSNVYSKILSGTWPYANMNHNLRRRHVDFNPNLIIDNLQYKLARLILKEWDVILILEMWDITKLQLKCNGLYNDTLPHENRGSNNHLQLNNFQRLKNEMIKLNTFDMELYKYAQHLSVKHVEECGNEIDNKYKQYLEYNNSEMVTNVTHKEWKLIYFQNITWMLNKSNASHLYKRTNFTDIKMNAIKNNISYIFGSEYGFYIESYLKWKREVWNDILMLTIVTDPLQMILDDLIRNCVFDNDINLEKQLIECLFDENKYNIHIKSNILCKIFSGTFSDHQIIDSIQYETAKLILNEFDVILMDEMWNENKLLLTCNNLISIPFVKQNQSVRKINEFPQLKQQLIQYNKYDIALYQTAIELVESKVKNCI